MLMEYADNTKVLSQFCIKILKYRSHLESSPQTLKRSLIRVKWFFVRTAARARSDPVRDAGRLAMARSFHVNVRHESSLD